MCGTRTMNTQHDELLSILLRVGVSWLLNYSLNKPSNCPFCLPEFFFFIGMKYKALEKGEPSPQSEEGKAYRGTHSVL